MTMRELREVFGQKVIDFTISKDLLCYDEVMDREYLEERIRFLEIQKRNQNFLVYQI